MATISAEDAMARFQDLDQRYNALLQRVSASEEEHRRTHAQLEASRAQHTHGEFRLIDPKTMVPERLSGRDQWRGWADASRSYIENLSTRLADLLKEAEGRSDPLSEAELIAAAIEEKHVAQLNRYLKLRTEPSSNPNTLIKAAQANKVHPLEQWRRLSHEYDPKGLGSEFVEMQELMAPERLRARTVAGVSAAVEAWEAIERRHRECHGLTLPEKCRITDLFKLAPESLSTEILKNNTKWESYQKLKDHLLSLQFLRTSGPAPMLQNVEEELMSETITTEDGDLMRLEKRDGENVLVKAGPPRRNGPRDKQKSDECYRCGRKGHIRPKCTWSTHVDGGKPSPPPPPRTPAGNVEDSSGDTAEP